MQAGVNKAEVIKAEVIKAVLGGSNMTVVGRQFGVSRERIRQIVRAANVVPPTGLDNRQRLRDQVAEMAIDGMSDREIADHLGLTVGAVASDRRLSKVSECGVRERRLDMLRESLEQGMSIRAAAIKFGENYPRLRYLARAWGLKSAHGRHRDFSHRPHLIRKWRKQRRTWTEVDALLGLYEGREAYSGAAYLWARTNAPELTVGARGRASLRLAAE